ncbi:MAG: hypothetical protein WA864_12095, partial [Acetobacteraceae bacterium]
MLQRVLHGVDHRDSRTNGISPSLRRGAVISSAVHLVILLVLLLGLPFAQPVPEPQETAIAMVFDGTAESSIQAAAPAAVPAP